MLDVSQTQTILRKLPNNCMLHQNCWYNTFAAEMSSKTKKKNEISIQNENR